MADYMRTVYSPTNRLVQRTPDDGKPAKELGEHFLDGPKKRICPKNVQTDRTKKIKSHAPPKVFGLGDPISGPR